ncbi:MAG: hypothetical protein ACI82F_001351, partial [Planctomycetota bacterium]
MKHTFQRRGTQRGFALVAVLLVLMALFLLTTPFLFTTTSANRSSVSRADQARVALALDTASRHARAELANSHGSLDSTPWYDSLEELAVGTDFPEELYNPQDPEGVQWDLEATDISGLVDLNSAPTQVFGNLLGTSSTLAQALEKDGSSLRLTNVAGLEPTGFVWLGPELMSYSGIEGKTLTGVKRGDEAIPDYYGDPVPRSFELGRAVLDQRTNALVLWRLGATDGDLRAYDGFDQIADAEQFVLAGKFGPDDLRILQASTTVFGDIGAGARWQQPTRVAGNYTPAEEDSGDVRRLLIEDMRWINVGTTIKVEQDGFSETVIVRSASNNAVYVLPPLQGTYDAYRATVRPMARRPVNINTASPLVLKALVVNLRLRGESSFMTDREATSLVEVMLESRPFDGFEDFLRRIVLPAAGLAELPKDAPVVPEVFAPVEGDEFGDDE